MTKLKLYGMVIGVAFLSLSNTACTKENDKDGKNTSVEIASANEIKPQVDIIETVDKPVRGKVVNFTWKENGKTYNFADYTKNKVVMLNFWGTWCGPCKMEIPDLIELDKELSDKEFVLVGISLEHKSVDDNIKTVKNFIKAKNITYRSFVPKDQTIIEAVGGIQGVPTTFIINKKGFIVETILGPRSKSQFLEIIKRAMKS